MHKNGMWKMVDFTQGVGIASRKQKGKSVQRIYPAGKSWYD